ncbi:conserved hypothetical protein [Streptomyces sp. SPB074]|nr:conserved hypothetical protein [Streptomyces sp. SPB074]
MSHAPRPHPTPTPTGPSPTDEELRRTLLAAYDAQLRGENEFSDPRARVERDGALVRFTGIETGYITGPRDLGVEGDALDALIARQRDRYAGLGIETEWKTRGHDAQRDLPARLRAAGFVPEEPETVFVGRTEDVARLQPRLPDGLRMRDATSLADLRAIDAMNEEIWGEPHAHAEELHRTLATSPDTLTVLLVEADPDATPAPTPSEQPPDAMTPHAAPPPTATSPATPPPPTPLHASRIGVRPRHGLRRALVRTNACCVARGAACTARRSPRAPVSPPHAASDTSRSTRAPTARPSCAASASWSSRRRRPTSGRRPPGDFRDALSARTGLMARMGG